MRWHKNILAVIFAVTGAAGICCAWAADKKGLEYLEFIPSDEIVDFKTQSYANKSISEVSCNCGDRNYFQEAADCLYCIKVLQVLCKDCCLITNTANWKIRCRKSEDEKYDCPQYKLFQANACGQVGNTNCNYWNPDPCCKDEYQCPPVNKDACQMRGCSGYLSDDGQSLSFRPAPTGECWPADGTGKKWYCHNQYSEPEAKRCGFTIDAKTGFNYNLSSCSSLSSYYTIQKREPCPDGSGGKCFEHTATAGFQSCVGGCEDTANRIKGCLDGRKCCESSVQQNYCGGSSYTSSCNEEYCLQRIEPARRTCGTTYRSGADCLTLMNSAIQALQTDCSYCAKQIDEDFVYKFVYKSGYKVFLNWKLNTVNESSIQIPGVTLRTYLEGSPAYLFTAIYVSDDPQGNNVVYRSFLHQKHFQTNFSIDAATVVPDGILKAGRPYYVRVYYFIPSLEGVTLQVKVTSLQVLSMLLRGGL